MIWKACITVLCLQLFSCTSQAPTSPPSIPAPSPMTAEKRSAKRKSGDNDGAALKDMFQRQSKKNKKKEGQ